MREGSQVLGLGDQCTDLTEPLLGVSRWLHVFTNIRAVFKQLEKYFEKIARKLGLVEEEDLENQPLSKKSRRTL